MAKNHSPQFLKLCLEAKKGVRELSVEQVHDRLNAGGPPFHLVDVREESEWAAGHLPGAIHLGRGVIERDIEKTIPDFSAEIICYCGGGFRSALVCESLQKMGYKRIFSMDGGWSGWREKNFPVVS